MISLLKPYKGFNDCFAASFAHFGLLFLREWLSTRRGILKLSDRKERGNSLPKGWVDQRYVFRLHSMF